MGWGRMLLFGNIGQQMDIQDNETALAELRTELRSSGHLGGDAAARIDRLESDSAELKLYVAAVIRLLVSRGIVSRDELERIVSAIDASDGKTDGRFDGPLKPG